MVRYNTFLRIVSVSVSVDYHFTPSETYNGHLLIICNKQFRQNIAFLSDLNCFAVLRPFPI